MILIISAKNGFEIPFTRSAIEFVSVRFRFLAELFGVNPFSAMVSMIFFLVSGLMSG